MGPSRHLVRFVIGGTTLYALKEEPAEVARREYLALLHMEHVGLPAVRPIGIAERTGDGRAILVTEFLRHSLQYRRLLMRVPLEPGAYRDRLLDAMAGLLVDLHRAGVYWGDCSLANTLFRRDGDTYAAYLVDAETSEIHATLSDGQRGYDLDLLVENVAFGLADLAAFQGRPEAMDEQIEAAEAVRVRYTQLWDELFGPVEIEAGDRALEGQARLLLNDLAEYRYWLEYHEGRRIPSTEAAERWQRDVLGPTLARLGPVIGPSRDPLQAYCDLLEHKWLLSERRRSDVGLEAAFAAYLEAGAPAPEARGLEASLDAEADAGLEVAPARVSPDEPMSRGSGG